MMRSRTKPSRICVAFGSNKRKQRFPLKTTCEVHRQAMIGQLAKLAQKSPLEKIQPAPNG
jgi:hypothetical protein